MKPKLVNKGNLRKRTLEAIQKPTTALESDKLPFSLLRRVVLDHAESLGDLYNPLLRICDTGNVQGYFDLQVFNSPAEHSGWRQYSDAALVLSFLKKYPFGKVAGLDPQLTAIKRFDEAERLCRATNKRLKWFRSRGFRLDRKHKGLHGIIHHARHIVNAVLGPLDLNEVYDYTRHGPGGALGVTGTRTTSYYKYDSSVYTVSSRAIHLAEAAILADPLWRRFVHSGSSAGMDVPSPHDACESVRSRLRCTNYNKVTFVPKTAQTHRAIAIEPLMNIFLQLGVGDFITQKLRGVGIDLRDQSKNQRLAHLGSLSDVKPEIRPITLDLSMASDTLAIELVRELLPQEWFDLLSDIRSEFGVYEKRQIHWAKFSSMGNGFTFPLETLIFYALSKAVGSAAGLHLDHLSVYGDDIVVPGGMALHLVEVLNYCGFRVNTEKSYFFGPFRESCGTDWFEGRDVRPFFLKEKIQNARDLIFIFNSITFAVKSFSYGEVDQVARFILNRLPEVIRDNLLGPSSSDLTGHLFCPWDVAQKSRFVLWDREVQAWSFVTCRDSPKVYRGNESSAYLQLIGSTGSVVVDHTENTSFLINWSLGFNYRLARWLMKTDFSPVNSGEIVRRESTRQSLVTSTSNSWRNMRHLALGYFS